MSRRRSKRGQLAILLAYTLVLEALLVAGSPMAVAATVSAYAWCSEVGTPAPGPPARRDHDSLSCCFAGSRAADPLILPVALPQPLTPALARGAPAWSMGDAPPVPLRSAAPLPPRGPPFPA